MLERGWGAVRRHPHDRGGVAGGVEEDLEPEAVVIGDGGEAVVDAEAMAGLAGVPGINAVCADIEREPWPFQPGGYDGIVATNYLHRPLLPALCAAVAETRQVRGLSEEAVA